jgi:RNA polymerase sigma-70 factor (ECF subfamily)
VGGKVFPDMLGVSAQLETNPRRERELEAITAAKVHGVYKRRKPLIDREEVRWLYDDSRRGPHRTQIRAPAAAPVRGWRDATEGLLSATLIEQLEGEIPGLRRFARALVGNLDRADDLVQDTLERALKHLATFQPGTNLRAWLFTILRNSNINEVRRARMTTASPDAMEALLPPVAASQEHGIVVRDLHRALGALSAEMREVVLLVGLEGLSYEETAAALGARVGTIKSRLSRGREALRRLLEGAAAPQLNDK